MSSKSLSPADLEAASDLLRQARAEGRTALLETEGMEIARILGLGVPEAIVVRDAAEAARADLEALRGERCVVKVLATGILHKSDVGGIAIAAREREAVASAVRAMEARLAGEPVAGFAVVEFVPHERALGHELLLGLRYTPDFGPVLTLGPGGVFAEHLAGSLRAGSDVALASPALTPRDELESLVEATVVGPLLLGRLRGQAPLVEAPRMRELLERALDFAARFLPDPIAELEFNPVVVSGGGLVALDAVVRLGQTPVPVAPPRPLAKLKQLLEPRSAAVIGVSEKMNPGHVILRNLLREGFPPQRLYVIKPDRDELDGCRCVPDVEALPERVDLLVVAVDAPQVPPLVDAVLEGRRAESLILIPGGLGEREGTEDFEARLRGKLVSARASDWGGPLINGGNCLGIRSRPGRYDTMFIPPHKLPQPSGPDARLAVVSQSGAFAIALASQLGALRPKYLISVGNQTDLTLGDYLQYLSDDPGLDVVACYAEAFRPGDGVAFLEAAAEMVRRGRRVILYRAGRTAAGAKATASHTAAVAGDYAVARALATAAGVDVAETLADFVDLVRLHVLLADRPLQGRRLGALSNAGFECVAIADSLGPFTLAALAPETQSALAALLERCGIATIVSVRNPLDATPIMGDAAFAEAAQLVLDDPHVDVGLVGCVPLTGALETLAAGPGHREDLTREGSVVSRLVALRRETEKPFVAVIDAGPLYDAAAAALQAGGIPTFRKADRALQLLSRLPEEPPPAA
jgi:acyl-CoA synthetase (NDP forming)